MAEIILDFGSGNTCKNDKEYIKRMIDELKGVDSGKHELIIKWQLWSLTNPQGANLHLNWGCFEYAYTYAKSLGYKTTASVFDKESLDYLLSFDVPFVKIACRESLYWLAGEVPRKIPIYMSVYKEKPRAGGYYALFCVPEYPASMIEYPKNYKLLSDHTQNLDLFKRNNPSIIEMHYALADSTGLDAESGVCKTPEMLAEIL